MIHGISEYEKFKVVRPIIGECEYDAFQIPIMKKTTFVKVNIKFTKNDYLIFTNYGKS